MGPQKLIRMGPQRPVAAAPGRRPRRLLCCSLLVSCPAQLRRRLAQQNLAEMIQGDKVLLKHHRA